MIFLLTHDRRRDRVLPTLLCDKRAQLRLITRLNSAVLLVDDLFRPCAFIKYPVLENSLDVRVAANNQIAVNVRNNRLDIDLFALLNKCPRRFYTNIQRRRMNEQRR